jgi:hypothetical protein
MGTKGSEEKSGKSGYIPFLFATQRLVNSISVHIVQREWKQILKEFKPLGKT